MHIEDRSNRKHRPTVSCEIGPPYHHVYMFLRGGGRRIGRDGASGRIGGWGRSGGHPEVSQFTISSPKILVDLCFTTGSDCRWLFSSPPTPLVKGTLIKRFLLPFE